MFIIQYILAIVIVFYLLIVGYIKLTYKFWAYQPVFHVYHLYWWLFPCGIIDYELPKKNKFINPFQIQHFQYPDSYNDKNNHKSNHKNNELVPWDQMTSFIKQHYLQNKNHELFYNPSLKEIQTYFKGHSYPSIVSLYYEKEGLIEYKNEKKDLIERNNIIGCITSRPLYVTFPNESSGNNKHHRELTVYYVDFLCVHKQKRKQGIASELIQTHEYYQRRVNHRRNSNNNIHVSLFKREGKLTGIVPLVVFSSMGYKTENLSLDKFRTMEGFYSILRVQKSSVRLFYSFLKENKERFACIITPHLSNLVFLLEQNILTIYLLMIDDFVLSAYIFRNEHTKEKKRDCISCIGSLMSKHEYINETLFGFGCLHCFQLLKREISSSKREMASKNNPKNGNNDDESMILYIEHIGDNIFLNNYIQCIHSRQKYDNQIPMAYFFYNYAKRPFLEKEVFILC